MNAREIIAAGAVVLASYGLIKGEDSQSKKPIAAVSQAVDDMRRYQFGMPKFNEGPEDVQQRVNATLARVMQECLSKGAIDIEKYLKDKSEWPRDIQLKVRACCPHIENQEDVHFQMAIGRNVMSGKERMFDTKDGYRFFQDDIRCSVARIITPASVPAEVPIKASVKTSIKTPAKQENPKKIKNRIQKKSLPKKREDPSGIRLTAGTSAPLS